MRRDVNVAMHAFRVREGAGGESATKALEKALGACADRSLRWMQAGVLLPGEIALAARLLRMGLESAGGAASTSGAASAGGADAGGGGGLEERLWLQLLAFALVLRAEREGSDLVDLKTLSRAELLAERERRELADAGELLDEDALPDDREAWRTAVAASPLVRVWEKISGQGVRVVSRPFVLEGLRLSSARSWSAEVRIAEGVRRWMGGAAGGQAHGHGLSSGVLGDETWDRAVTGIQALIQGEGAEAQRRAAGALLRGRFHLLTGGPGTGKTYTVRSMLTLAWLHRRLCTPDADPLQVHLAAPTGKAAQRMKESMSDNLGAWCAQVREVLAALPLPASESAEGVANALEAFLGGLRASTLHRLLGYQHFNPTRFRHDRQHPLAADVVVVDEASMVELEMMASLADAVDGRTSLVLVGDRRQLASVGRGTVLADFCTWGARAAAHDNAPGDVLVELSVSRRFPQASPIGVFASSTEKLDGLEEAACAQGAREAVRALREAATREGGRTISFEAPPSGDVSICWPEEEAGKRDKALNDELASVADYWVGVMEELSQRVYTLDEEGRLGLLNEAGDAVTGEDPQALWRELDGWSTRVRVLAAHRRGPRGVESLNEEIWKKIKSRARPAGLSGVGSKSLLDPVAGKPIIVTRNDYEVRRFNGDVGLWVRLQRAGRDEPELAALFEGEGGRVEAHGSGMLPPQEAVWSMTVHKSQGSEFGRVVFVLPEESSALLTRELVYTGITRVKRELVVVGAPRVLEDALQSSIRRDSNLPARLASGPA